MARWSREERETLIRIDESEDEWTVWTASRPMMTRLDKIAVSTGIFKDRHGNIAKTYRLPFKSVSFRKPRKATAAQKKALEKARAQASAT